MTFTTDERQNKEIDTWAKPNYPDYDCLDKLW